MSVVVNNNKTYKDVAEGLVRFGPTPAMLDILRAITAGEWLNMTDESLRGVTDLLIGTFRNVVTVVYEICSWRRLPNGRLVFDVRPALGHVALIGTDQPGGPWQQGEARSTRRITDSMPGTEVDRDQDALRVWEQAVLEVARRFAPHVQPAQGSGTDSATLSVDDVRVSIEPGSRVVVDVPAGVEVLVRPAPST